MKEIRLILAGVLCAGLMVAAAPMASAYARSGDNPPADHATYKLSEQRVKLSPIVVNGQRLILPLYLQMVRTALHRPWSPLQVDKNKLVCRFQDMMGSRLQTLKCSTNGQHFKQQRETQLALVSARQKYAPNGRNTSINIALNDGQIPVTIANYTTQHRVNRGAIMALLKKLPPRGSSYTLRVTSHGKPVVDYVIKHGKLKAIHRYTSKKLEKN